MFVDLVDRAKYLANARTLKIVLVSSEGIVMPLIIATSSRSRLADTVEVLDISDEEALKLLINIPNKLAQRIVSVCGGRFVHLMLAKSRYFKLHVSGVEDINALYKSIIDHLVITNVELSIQRLLKHSDKERHLFRLILQEVFTNGEVKAQALARKLNETSGNIDAAVGLLVSSYLLRYGGAVVFHSRLVKWAFEKNLVDLGSVCK